MFATVMLVLKSKSQSLIVTRGTTVLLSKFNQPSPVGPTLQVLHDIHAVLYIHRKYG